MIFSEEILISKVLKIFNSQSHFLLTRDMVDVNLKKTGIDSLDMVNIIVMLEKLFCIPIFDDESEKLITINDCIKLIEKKLNEKLHLSI